MTNFENLEKQHVEAAKVPPKSQMSCVFRIPTITHHIGTKTSTTNSDDINDKSHANETALDKNVRSGGTLKVHRTCRVFRLLTITQPIGTKISTPKCDDVKYQPQANETATDVAIM